MGKISLLKYQYLYLPDVKFVNENDQCSLITVTLIIPIKHRTISFSLLHNCTESYLPKTRRSPARHTVTNLSKEKLIELANLQSFLS